MLVVLAAVLLLFTETHSTVCNSGQKLLTEPKGQISSPNPGQSGTCSWKLDVPEDSRIIFYFKFYDIDHCSYPATKCTDCTRIELKDSSNEPPWHTFCDYKSELPEPISTNTSTLFVNFVLSRDDSKSWFTAEYETWPSQGKVDLITTSRAEISSPLFPGKYPRNSYFQWLVVAPSEYRVKIEFSKFDVHGYCSTSECTDGAGCDFLTVRDGASPQSKLLGRYCSRPEPLHTSGNNVWIEFVASMNRGYNSDSSGFKATVSREIKLYVIVVPCVLGILFVSLVAAIVVVTCRRRRLSPSGNGAPVVQMSLLNEDDNLSNTHLPDVGPHNEASLPVYRPTTQKIRR